MSVGAKGIHNTAGLVAFRFCLGLLEAGELPHSPDIEYSLSGLLLRVLPWSNAVTQLLVQTG